MKRVLCTLLCLLLLIVSIPQICFANDYSGSIGELTWRIDGISGELMIDGVGSAPNGTASPFETYSRIIKTVTIGDSVTALGAYMFSNCTNIETVNFNSIINAIPNKLFNNCTSIKEIALTDAINYVSPSAFDGCTALESVDVSILNKTYTSYKSVLYSADKSILVKVPANIVDAQMFSIPTSVSIIGEKAFYQCNNMNSLTLGQGITEIRDNAFTGSSITSIEILNTECDINGNNVFPSSCNIKCYPNSTADKYCKQNGITSQTLVVNKDDCIHSYNSYVIKPTCIKQGYTQDKCKYCENTINKDYKNALGHSYTKQTVSATFTKNGYTREYCEHCKAVKNKKDVYYVKSVKLENSKYTYDGKKHKPKLTIKNSAGAIIPDTMYTRAYSKDTTSVGKHTVTVKLNGNYSGTKTYSYKIIPKGTTVLSLTSPKSKKIKLKWKKNTTQTTGYQIWYSTSKSFKTKKSIKLSNKTHSKTIKVDKSKKIYYIKIRTYKTVGNTNYYSSWSKTYKIKAK